MTLTLLEDHDRDGFRIRVTDCDCDVPGCRARFVFAQYGHGQLWVCTGAVDIGATDDQVEWMLDDDEIGGACASEIVEHGVAMFGLTWPHITVSRAVAVQQLAVFDRCPDWMCRLPIEDVWACRGWVFGRDLSRVPRALWALHRAYVPEAPAVVR